MNQATVPTDKSYIAHLWEHPELTLAIFGIQVQNPATYTAYQADVESQLGEALSQAEGLLCVRQFEEGNGGLSLQYWRSHADLSSFSKRMPHMAWWKWLIEHEGKGVSFYHEIYQCKTAEAIFETGTTAVGPGTFCTTSTLDLGGGRSVERQERFTGAAAR